MKIEKRLDNVGDKIHLLLSKIDYLKKRIEEIDRRMDIYYDVKLYREKWLGLMCYLLF